MKNKEKYIMFIWLGALVSIIVLGVIMSFQRPSEELIKANKEILSIAEKIRSFYRNRPDYWGLNNNEVIQQKLYDGKMNNNQLFNSLGKPLTIGGDSEGNQVMPGRHSFIIGYHKLNKQECQGLASFLWAEEDKLGLISLSIQNTKGKYEFSWGEGLPLSRRKSKKYCEEENSVLWTFE